MLDFHSGPLVGIQCNHSKPYHLGLEYGSQPLLEGDLRLFAEIQKKNCLHLQPEMLLKLNQM